MCCNEAWSRPEPRWHVILRKNEQCLTSARFQQAAQVSYPTCCGPREHMSALLVLCTTVCAQRTACEAILLVASAGVPDHNPSPQLHS
jgi:hypothetical protein